MKTIALARATRVADGSIHARGEHAAVVREQSTLERHQTLVRFDDGSLTILWDDEIEEVGS